MRRHEEIRLTFMTRRQLLAGLSGLAALAITGCSLSSRQDVLVNSHSSAAPGQSGGSSKASACYELRIYTINPGKAEALHDRFRNHTLRLFKKHRIESVGYWMPVDSKDQRLHFLLRYPSREAREASWKAFLADPSWQAAYKASEAAGPILAKGPENFFLETTPYSPPVRKGDVSHGGVWELRTYTTPPGRVANIDARFRDHTIALFAKHGIGNQGYFHKMAGQEAADSTLLYFLTHKSPEAAKASFSSFGQDPAWKAAREASEKAAGGSLTIPGGVKSVFLKATDYSPAK